MSRVSRMRRFWSKVQPNRDTGCWEWTAARDDGYGRFVYRVDGRKVTDYAHRVAYQSIVGPIPSGLQIDHLCRTRWCVNPLHMEVVTNKINTLRGNAPSAHNARKTHCPKGHPLSGDNLYVWPKRGWRQCRTCNRARQRRKL